MSEETPRRPITSETERSRRARFGKYLAAVLVAMPGAYAAVRTQYTADADSVKTEVDVRDRQEVAFRMHFEALRREIAAVRATSVSHKEFLELVVKLRDRERVYRPRSPARRTEASAREKALEVKLEEMRERERKAVAARTAAKIVQKKLPALKSSKAVRTAIKRGL